MEGGGLEKEGSMSTRKSVYLMTIISIFMKGIYLGIFLDDDKCNLMLLKFCIY